MCLMGRVTVTHPSPLVEIELVPPLASTVIVAAPSKMKSRHLYIDVKLMAVKEKKLSGCNNVSLCNQVPSHPLVRIGAAACDLKQASVLVGEGGDREESINHDCPTANVNI